jgi:hypothetical protein
MGYNNDMMIVRLGSVVLDFLRAMFGYVMLPLFSYLSESTQHGYKLDDWQQQSLSICMTGVLLYSGRIGLDSLGGNYLLERVSCILHLARWDTSEALL